MRIRLVLGLSIVIALCFVRRGDPAVAAEPTSRPAAAPRIVNLYNFVRNSDYRVPNSEAVLFETTRQELELIRAAKLPATWALQYDALMNPAYPKLFKERLGPGDEVAAWWELPRPLVEKAGIRWRGAHDWDSTANVGFSPGYTPDERRKLVDVYMADFKAAFGLYPRTVGSWYVDEVTLAYMVDRYGVVASCNCKDQVGTDGYTLWGGYWAGAYYPSKANAYMPAQTKEGQIDVPVFRMLGNDPIYQYGRVSGMYTLEPVYPQAGGSPAWVDWFLGDLTNAPCLAYAYAQAGQENSFGWDAIGPGLTLQVAALAKAAKAGDVLVETLEQSGRWFREHHPLTPATAVVALDDWKHQGRRTVWYDSRFYRLNLLWEGDMLTVRDLHRFDETVASANHETPLTKRSLTCGTLPIMDGSLWSTKDRPAGIRPVLLAADETATAMAVEGPPAVTESNATDLSVAQPLRGGGSVTIVCREADVTFTAVDGQGRPLPVAWDMTGGPKLAAAVRSVAADGVVYRSAGREYRLAVAPRAGTCHQLKDGTLRLTPGAAGKLALVLGGS